LHATFAVNHRLLLETNSAGYGEVQTHPASADGFHSAGTIVQATAVPAPGFCFAGWSGIVPISEPTIALALTRPYALTAHFQPGTVSLPPVLQVPHYAHTLSLPVTAQSGCIWNAATDSAWISVSPAGYHSSLSLPITVSANPTRTPRSGRVRILGQWTTIHQDGRP
jgi:hypothetical protein